jgi:phage terminase small subunit
MNRPIPTKLKILRGNPGKRPIGQLEPKATGIPICPRFLKGEARLEWRRQIKELSAIGVLASCDRPKLAGFCVSWQKFVEAYEKNDDITLDKMLKQVRAYGADFGMDASSRTRIAVAKPTESDRAKKFFGDTIPLRPS